MAEDPAVTLSTDEETWADIASGKITASSAAATGAGDPEAAERMRRIFAREPMLARAQATIDRAP
jgi:putative sterol carrier protein